MKRKKSPGILPEAQPHTSSLSELWKYPFSQCGGGGGGSGPYANSARKFLPTLSDLVDRLSIVQLKAIFIPEHREEYLQERALLEHDIDMILAGKKVTASDVHAILVIMLANRFIWENEAKARQGGHENDHLLRITHSINGIRNAAKNKLARLDSGRKDYKIDALAADLPPEFGAWGSVFEVDNSVG